MGHLYHGYVSHNQRVKSWYSKQHTALRSNHYGMHLPWKERWNIWKILNHRMGTPSKKTRVKKLQAYPLVI